jgi:DNA-binding NtrC family response regulator
MGENLAASKAAAHSVSNTPALAGRTVLVIDDSAAVRTALEFLLSAHGIEVVSAATPEEGLQRLEQHPIDLVIQDMNFTRGSTSGDEGVALFRRLKDQFVDLPVMLLTAWTHLDTAVELVRAGAADYLAKPWDDARLLVSVQNLLQLRSALSQVRKLRSERVQARAALAQKYDLRSIVYESSAMHALLLMATQVAHAEVPVLIAGPSGAGKEVVADIIHANSSCAAGPYVKVNVGALPNELIEGELFGSEPGAYTGARSRAGRFESAHGGSLFLDEISNLSLAGQAKLLRVLQSGEFERLGSTTTQRVKVRILSATNCDLRRAIAEGRFREDLYYRLNVIELRVPPLAERRDDILPLAREFLTAGLALSAAAERVLLSYSWPGNVRQLKNTMQRACLLSPSRTVEVDALGLPAVRGNPVEPELDRTAIERALEQAGGVVAQAARELGLSRQALYRRMEKLGIGGADAQ